MNLDAYVGLPWRERGRCRAGLDCWGLLRLVYAERLSVDLPSFAEDYVTTADAEAVSGLIAGHLGPWREVDPERPGDAVLLSMAGLPRHVGVVVEPGLALHIEKGAGAVIESYRSHRLRRRVLGFYRHEALA